MMKSVLFKSTRLFHTLRHLRFEQFYYRIIYKLKRPKVTCLVDSDNHTWSWQGPCLFKQSIFGASDVCFLNKKGLVEDKADWNSSKYEKLWLYNLHYFDDLNSVSYEDREIIHYQFIDRWINDNSPCLGNGWEPYPTSLRLVNWVKWFSRKSDVVSKHLNSIAMQANALSQQIEYHILGNHLFANAKALVFVGTYLQGNDASRFLGLGLKILDREISEQFLDDGAHFELSPMYHEILLWDLLELIDLAQVSQNPSLLERALEWRLVAKKALSWLETMLHPDNEISFFNDAAIGVAAKPHQIFDYAEKLKLSFNSDKRVLVTKEASGYSRIDTGDFTLFFDHANVGPDYLPGHAHADTLSFEMSAGKHRLFVNSGTSLYGISDERLRQRGTAAHNTVVVQKQNSSEVWSGFRVASRAYGRLLSSTFINNKAVIVASHDGYKRLNPKLVHTRTIAAKANECSIIDELSYPAVASYHLHLHPDVAVVEQEEKRLVLQLPCLTLVEFESEFSLTVEDSTWHPEFGMALNNKKIIVAFITGRVGTKITILKDVY